MSKLSAVSWVRRERQSRGVTASAATAINVSRVDPIRPTVMPLLVSNIKLTQLFAMESVTRMLTANTSPLLRAWARRNAPRGSNRVKAVK